MHKYVIVNMLQYDMFLKKYQSQTHILTISNGMNMSLPPPCFSVLKMYKQKLNCQVFPMKTGRLSRYGQNVWKINGKEMEYLWVKENLIVPKQKSHRIIFHILCDMGSPCSKLNKSKLVRVQRSGIDTVKYHT